MKKLGPIYLIRHGETVWNRASRLQGHKDTPLTMKGVKQAQALGFALKGVLKNKTPSFFYSSPIGRAKQTAAIISDIIDFDVERIEYKSSLKEITFGDWDGLNMQEILTQYKTSWEKRKTDKWNTSPLMARVFKKLKNVSHTYWMKLLINRMSLSLPMGPLIKLLEGVGAIFQKPKHSLWMNRRTDFTVSSMRIENILYRFSWA